MSSIALKISQLISQKNLTKKEFADLFNISRVGLDDYIKGKTVPRVDLLENIALKFNLPMTYFFDDIGTPMRKGISSNCHNALNYKDLDNNEANLISENELKAIMRQNELLEEMNQMLKEQIKELKRRLGEEHPL